MAKKKAAPDEEKELELRVFQDRLGYHFKNPDFLAQALTHASTAEDENYERLEFLGDRVLGLVVAEILYRCFPYENEGALARRHSALACTETLAGIARGLDLPDIVRTSQSEKNAGGSKQDNLLADCMEAIIGAIFLDRGYVACQEVITALWGDKIYTLMQPPIDSKTALQEWTQARKLGVPSYEIVNRDGPDHAPVFTICVSVEGHDPVKATGSSRRTAEKLAAQILYDRLKDEK
ncbi:MAG TPA: ribonuclease III [Alphaproteobacteria bacterium]|nr:ribonuclease III [Alphaproteobacteria bacterium]HNS43752.1 ribonuclease III [Alphaproteobacteria bacterium]